MAVRYLFRNVRIADPESSAYGRTVDVLVRKGVVEKIGRKIEAKAKVIDGRGKLLFPGFCDLYADFCDPGYEHREDIRSGMDAAAAGGFTTVCVVPDTQPIVQNKSAVEYIRHRAAGHAVNVYSLGAVSENLQGKNPTEMYDMHKAGAIGFTDAPNSVLSSGLLLRALQYVQPFNGVVFDMSTDSSLSNDGHLSEGEVSVRMGLKGVPHMAEVVQLSRNIELLRYAGGRLHIYGVTTKDGVSLIRAAKKEGLDITASVFVHHLLYTDEDMRSYDSLLKVQPPLRRESDRKALIKGLRDGVIDAVATQHTPLEIEEKKLEFEYATPGITGLETAYYMLCEALGDPADPEEIAQWMSIGPRKVLGLKTSVIEEGEPANLTLADPDAEWTYDELTIRSRSTNHPRFGKTLKGRIAGIYHNSQWLPNER